MDHETSKPQPDNDHSDSDVAKENRKDENTTPLIYPQEGLINRTLP